MFTLSILFQAIGYAIYAACKNVSQYIVSTKYKPTTIATP